MKLVNDASNPKKKGVKLNPTKAALASTKATLMSLMYTIIRKLSRVVRNQRRNTANLKLVATRVSTPKNPLVLESVSDSTVDYPDEEFTDASDEDRAEQGGSDEEGRDESVGDHVVGDQGDDGEEEVERFKLKDLEYEEGDDKAFPYSVCSAFLRPQWSLSLFFS